MTLDRLIPAYMQLRGELLQRGAPLGNWTVSISPVDAMDLQLETKEPVAVGDRVYGAVWVQDAEVPQGELWLTIQAHASKHVIKVP